MNISGEFLDYTGEEQCREITADLTRKLAPIIGERRADYIGRSAMGAIVCMLEEQEAVAEHIARGRS